VLFVNQRKGHTTGKGGSNMNEKQKEPKPNWEIADPKPPVIRSGRMENRKSH
jgi:hypothetical protein